MAKTLTSNPVIRPEWGLIRLWQKTCRFKHSINFIHFQTTYSLHFKKKPFQSAKFLTRFCTNPKLQFFSFLFLLCIITESCNGVIKIHSWCINWRRESNSLQNEKTRSSHSHALRLRHLLLSPGLLSLNPNPQILTVIAISNPN
jgi:hypothetical protein